MWVEIHMDLQLWLTAAPEAIRAHTRVRKGAKGVTVLHDVESPLHSSALMVCDLLEGFSGGGHGYFCPWPCAFQYTVNTP